MTSPLLVHGIGQLLGFGDAFDVGPPAVRGDQVNISPFCGQPICFKLFCMPTHSEPVLVRADLIRQPIWRAEHRWVRNNRHLPAQSKKGMDRCCKFQQTNLGYHRRALTMINCADCKIDTVVRLRATEGFGFALHRKTKSGLGLEPAPYL